MTHGKLGTYNNHKCRCEACRLAQADYQRVWMRAEYQRRQNAGQCVRCANPASARSSRCEACLDRARAYAERKRRARAYEALAKGA